MAFQTPDWVKHAVFYQIFPDRFARTQRHLDDPAMAVPLEPWESLPTPFGYKGGDLWGIAEKLDYLADLGVTAIYMTPIFQSACNHRYHTHDYYQVDPLLGGNPAFFDLLEAAHAKDIKVVLDGVFNHSSRGFFFFNDILENGPNSPWLEWFEVEGWPLAAYDGSLPANYRSWVDNRALPTFKHGHPAVREYLMRVGEYWVRQGIDGWRLDVPYEIKTEGFWQEFRDRIKAINPEAYIVGEVWDDATQWLDGTQFDGVMNYLFTAPTMAFVAGDRIRMDLVEQPHYYPYPALDAASYGDKIQHLLALYPWEIQLTQLNLLSSHDVARIYSVVGEDDASMVLCTLLLFTFPGAPSVYYGDEVGLPGELDPDCRRTFPPENDWHLDLLTIHRELIALRHRFAALRTGTYEVLHTEGNVYVFSRTWGRDRLIIALNAGESDDRKVSTETLIDKGRTAHAVFTYHGATWASPDLTLPPRSAVVVAVEQG
ncbi:glycoside hydrolase family 13 protein [Leptolyngbya sp. CCNP1308]|uniref:glycoside hydrolase family 13 protein n=1 Tax=Leptolyngbya sp. CCNP1308 TaxID=3110255 RepID=UPI002B1EF83F|nr:glycoside hydrolase family 13 protein [Leptolyngbya sp. CCNP1308]MEA5450305.1 glycoside hydrolase family 13 protein [Leptolyngbya sp. CCNP1308]